MNENIVVRLKQEYQPGEEYRSEPADTAEKR